MRKLSFTLTLLIIAIFSQAQVTQINSNKTLRVQFALNSNTALLISDIDSTLWASDGTQAGTVQLSPDIFFRGNGGLLNGKFYFAANSATYGTELYATDGTVAGTGLVKDIYPGPTGSFPYQNFALLNGYLYFTAFTAAEGRELWRTDGTASGTTLVKDIFPGTTSSNTGTGYNLYSNGSFLLFGASSSPSVEVELWKSDGTPGGTQLLKDINTFAGKGSKPDYFNNLGSTTLFMANDSLHGNEIWKTDGSAAGTVLLKDIYSGTASSISYAFFREFNGKYFFTANDGIFGEEVWTTDGTTANTNMLKDIFPGSTGSYATVYNAVKVGSKIIFSALDIATGYELWESDGTAAGTKLLKDIAPGTDNSSPTLLLAYEFNYSNGTFTNPLFQGNKFFFLATTLANGTELWISDGTAAGTKMVKDINPGSGNGLTSSSYFYTTTGLYFGADDGVYGTELWQTDGTTAATTRVSDINSGPASADIQMGVVVNNKLIFSATNGDAAAKDLYRLDAAVTTLPVLLMEFSASKVKTDALLHWSSSCEVNSKTFTVQRSLTGKDFANIGTVNASGNSCEKRNYSFIDAGIFAKPFDKVYYRLLMTDIDGKNSYSRILTVKGSNQPGWNFKLLQNPVINTANITITDATDKVTILIKDIKGNNLNLSKVVSENGQTSLNVSMLVPGIYSIIAETGNERKVIRFIKL